MGAGFVFLLPVHEALCFWFLLFSFCCRGSSRHFCPVFTAVSEEGLGSSRGCSGRGLQLHQPLLRLGFLRETHILVPGRLSPGLCRWPPHNSHPQWVLGTPEACRKPPTAELCLAGTRLLGPGCARQRAPRFLQQPLHHYPHLCWGQFPTGYGLPVPHLPPSYP